MLEFLMIAAPGALTWLVDRKLSRHKSTDQVKGIMEFFVYSLLDFGILWLVQGRGDLTVKVSGSQLWISLLVALAAGFVAALVHLFDVQLEVDRKGKRSKTGKAVFLVAAGLLGAVCLVFFAVRPYWKTISRSRTKEQTQAYVKEMLEEIRTEVKKQLDAGVQPDELADIELGDLTVKRVISDQRWVNGTGLRGQEAVYMVDGNGDVVYISYRDQNYAGTWSGVSKDKEFIAAKGGWNGGKGYSWTGKLFADD